MFIIKEATTEDAEAIKNIQNYYIEKSTASFHESGYSTAAMAAKIQSVQNLHYPFLVARDEKKQIAGFAYLSKFREQSAYRIAECSIYITPEYVAHGAGKLLYRQLIKTAKASGRYSGLVAVISADNLRSLKFHEYFNFVQCGRIERAGFKFNQYCTIILMHLSFE